MCKGTCKKAGDFLPRKLGTVGNGFKLKENRFDKENSFPLANLWMPYPWKCSRPGQMKSPVEDVLAYDKELD